MSFAIEDGPSAYLPVRHEGGGNLDQGAVFSYLRDQAASFRGDLVGANLQYDLDHLAQAGVEFRPRFFRDIQVAEPLLDELQHSYSMQSIAERRNLPGKSEGLLREAAEHFGVDPKAGLWQLDSRYVGAYAEHDARLPLQILRRQEHEVERQNLQGVFDLESRLLPVLLKMRRLGVRVNLNHLSQVEEWCTFNEQEKCAEISRLSGITFVPSDLSKSAAKARLLKAQGIQLPLTPTGKDQVKNEHLLTIDDPICRLLVRACQIQKVRTTFVKSIRQHAVGDRIHCTFNQLRGSKEFSEDDTGARYGRISSCDPNLQQQPARDPEIGPLWRRIYIPDEEGWWTCADYSQQEPRWTTHYAEAAKCAGAREAGDRYRSDPNTDNHQMMADLTGVERKKAKEIFLGLCYGMGGAKLCRKLGLPTKFVPHWRDEGLLMEVAGDEGQAMLDKFNAGVPFLKELAKRAKKAAEEKGYVLTILGRRCRFPVNPITGKIEWAHKGLNRVIQGSSGDQTKKAMVDADAAGLRLQLQVHDEIDMTCWKEEEQDELAHIMCTTVPCLVPARVDVEVGPSWGELKEAA